MNIVILDRKNTILKEKLEEAMNITQESEDLSFLTMYDNQEHEEDSEVLKKVIEELREREKVGKKKYGVTMDREDLSIIEWLQHAKEEALDSAMYLQKAIDILNK